MDFDDSVDNWNVSTFDLENEDLSSLDGLFLVVGQEQEVATVERRLHAATWGGEKGQVVDRGRPRDQLFLP